MDHGLIPCYTASPDKVLGSWVQGVMDESIAELKAVLGRVPAALCGDPPAPLEPGAGPAAAAVITARSRVVAMAQAGVLAVPAWCPCVRGDGSVQWQLSDSFER